MKFFPAVLSSGIALALCLGCGEKKENEKRDPPAPPGKDNPAPAPTPQPATPASNPAPNPANPRASLDADLARLMTGFGVAVKSVQDQASWAEAKPKIEAILGEIEIVGERLRTLPAPTPDEVRIFLPRTKDREAALEKTLGSKNDFLRKLPKKVADELGILAGQFFEKMGQAQIALRGTTPPVKVPARKPPR